MGRSALNKNMYLALQVENTVGPGDTIFQKSAAASMFMLWEGGWSINRLI